MRTEYTDGDGGLSETASPRDFTRAMMAELVLLVELSGARTDTTIQVVDPAYSVTDRAGSSSHAPIFDAVVAELEAQGPPRAVLVRPEVAFVPTAAQIFDHLVHARALIPEALAWPLIPLGVVSVVSQLPTCDACDLPARFDAPTEYGLWACHCPACFDWNGRGQVGAGTGTYLMHLSDVPEQVWVRCDGLTQAAGRPSLRPNDAASR